VVSARRCEEGACRAVKRERSIKGGTQRGGNAKKLPASKKACNLKKNPASGLSSHVLGDQGFSSIRDAPRDEGLTGIPQHR